MKLKTQIPLILFAALIVHSTTLAAPPKIEESLIVQHQNGDSLRIISKHSEELIIDHVKKETFEVYGPKGTKKWLDRIGVVSRFQPELGAQKISDYPTPEAIESTLNQMALRYPQTSSLFSIGKSSQGRNLWMMKVSRNARTDDQRPKFKFIANMHGDEIVGRELLTRLISHLLQNDGSDSTITRLLDDYQIYIMPSMNPDGAARGTRATAQGIDLNRDFPDFSTNDNQNSSKGRAPETVAIMNWQKQHQFALSANFHGGAEVVNYPWDTVPDKFPQESLVKSLSLDYAFLAPYIKNSTVFENGIVNGYEWYEVNGGMQDWSIHYHNDLQLTIELSDAKWPSYASVERYFQQNLAAMIDLIGKTKLRSP